MSGECKCGGQMGECWCFTVKRVPSSAWVEELDAAHALIGDLWQRAETQGAEGIQCYLTNAMECLASAYETEQRRSSTDEAERQAGK